MSPFMFAVIPGVPLAGLWLFLKACELRERREARIFNEMVTPSHVPATNTLVLDGYSGQPYPPAR
jgi:hypothetical protein